jgi:Flp pilus assembly protein TadG
MKRLFQKFGLDSRGAAILEFALAAPALLAMLMGIAQLGVIFLANAGLRSAVESGARYATTWPRPSATDISSKIAADRFGLNPANIIGPTVTPQTTTAPYYYDIAMGYTVTINYVVGTKTITLTETRRAYTPSD